MAVLYPIIGRWYRRNNGSVFEVVAIDQQDATVELQYFDGTIDEFDLENWPTLLLETVEAPDDWLGSVDMDPDDFCGRKAGEMPPGFHDPLAFLDSGK